MKHSGKNRPAASSTITVALGKGAVWSVGITIAGAAIMAVLIVREMLREIAIGYTAMVVLLLASWFGSKIAVRTFGKKLALTALTSGVIYFLILAGLNAVLYKGGYEGVGVTAVMILAGVGITILTELNRKERKSRIRM